MARHADALLLVVSQLLLSLAPIASARPLGETQHAISASSSDERIKHPDPTTGEMHTYHEAAEVWGSSDDDSDDEKLLPCPETACKTWGGGCISGYMHATSRLYASEQHCDRDVAQVSVAPAHNFPNGSKFDGPKKIALVHTGKTGGTELSRMLASANVNFTHLHPLASVEKDVAQYDMSDFDLFIIPTRDPVSRTISAYNWNHPTGGPGCQLLCWFGSGMLALNKFSDQQDALYECMQDAHPNTGGTTFGQVSVFAEALGGQGDGADCREDAVKCVTETDAGCRHMSLGFDYWLNQPEGNSVLSLLREAKNSTDSSRRLAIAVRNEDLIADADYMLEWLEVPEEQRISAADVGGVLDSGVFGEMKKITNSYPLQDDRDVSDFGRAALENVTKSEQDILDELDALVENPANNGVPAAWWIAKRSMQKRRYRRHLDKGKE